MRITDGGRPTGVDEFTERPGTRAIRTLADSLPGTNSALTEIDRLTLRPRAGQGKTADAANNH